MGGDHSLKDSLAANTLTTRKKKRKQIPEKAQESDIIQFQFKCFHKQIYANFPWEVLLVQNTVNDFHTDDTHNQA